MLSVATSCDGAVEPAVGGDEAAQGPDDQQAAMATAWACSAHISAVPCLGAALRSLMAEQHGRANGVSI
jgi:hypothetical protein